MLHGQTRYNLRSRFLEELPERALKWLTPRVQAASSAYREGWGGAWEGVNRQGGFERRDSAGRGAAGGPSWGNSRGQTAGRFPDRDSDVGRADASVKAGRWERKQLTGTELLDVDDPDYAPVKAIRHRASTSNMVLVEGA